MTRDFWFASTIAVVVFTSLTAWQRSVTSAASIPEKPDLPAKPLVISSSDRVAVFAGGCFWGIEEAFRKQPGVIATQAGYTGGTAPNPTYRFVHSSRTGYVESVEVVYDPAKVRYAQLLKVFFDNHDPTLPRPRAGRVIGDAYRSFVFVHDAEQKSVAESTIADMTRSREFLYPIETQVRPQAKFWPAEEHHQEYYEKQGAEAACNL